MLIVLTMAAGKGQWQVRLHSPSEEGQGSGRKKNAEKIGNSFSARHTQAQGSPLSFQHQNHTPSCLALTSTCYLRARDPVGGTRVSAPHTCSSVSVSFSLFLKGSSCYLRSLICFVNCFPGAVPTLLYQGPACPTHCPTDGISSPPPGAHTWQGQGHAFPKQITH